MALISVQCYLLPKQPSSSVSARTPVLRRVITSPVRRSDAITERGTRRPLQRCLCSQYAGEREPPDSPRQLERLFSNLNQATMKHDTGSFSELASQSLPIHLRVPVIEFCFPLIPISGSLTSAIFLVAGTTVLYCFFFPYSFSCCNVEVKSRSGNNC